MTQITREAAMAELYRRDAMTPEQKAAYEELMRRGEVQYERSRGERRSDNIRDGFERSMLGDVARSANPGDDGFFDFRDLTQVQEGSPLDWVLDRTAGRERGWFASNGQQYDPVGTLARGAIGGSMRGTARAAREDARRDSYEARAAADPIRDAGDMEAFVTGQVIGGVLSPENWAGGTAGAARTLLGRVGVRATEQAIIAGGVDVATQVRDIAGGIEDRFRPMQTLGAAALGAAFGATPEAIRPVSDRVRRAFTDPPRLPEPEPAPTALPEIDAPRTATSAQALDVAAKPVIIPDFSDVAPVDRGLIARTRQALDEKGVPRAARDFAAETWQRWSGRAYTAVVDEMHPVVRLRDRLVNEIEQRVGAAVDLLPSQDPLKLSRGKRDVFNIGQMDVLHGVHDYGTVKANGPALAEIVTAAGVRFTRAGKTVADGIDELGKYAAARRAIVEWKRREKGELEVDPVRTPRETLEAYVARIDQEQPEFRDLSDGLNDYAQGLLKKRLDAGLIERSVFDAALAARDFYTPLRRIMEADTAPPVAGGKNKTSDVRAFTGSQRDIENPVVALMEDTFRLAQRVRVNDLNLSLVSLAERLNKLTGGADNPFIRKVKAPAEKVAKAADAEDALDAEDAWKPGEINDAGRAVLYVWRDGKREAWELIDAEWGSMAFEAMSNMTKAQADLWVEVVGAGTTFLSRTITRDPAFLLANFMRDALSAWTLTDVVKPFEGVVGVADELAQADSSRLYNLGGGISGGESSSNVNSMLRTRDVSELARRFKWNPSAVRMRYMSDAKGILRLGADAFRATELTETGTRRQVFKKAFERARREGLNEYEAMLEASYTARDYADFGRHGSRMYAARRLVTFINPWMQGLDKLVRTAIADPASAIGRAYEAGGREAALKAILKPLFRAPLDGVPLKRADKAALRLAVHAWTRMAAMGVYGLGLSAILRDDPDYREANERNRATHWLIPVGNGVLYRQPKPFELAFVSNIMERGYEATVGDDPTAWGRMWAGLVEMFAPPSDVPLLNVATGLTTGVDPSTGRSIIPEGTEQLPPDLQYEWWTSQLAHHIGEDLGVAPAKIDFFMRTMGGPFGAYALKMSDATDPDRPSGSWVDAPVARRFFSPSFRGSQDKRDFFARAGARTSELERALNGIRQDEERGNLARAQQRFDRLDNAGRIYVTSQRGEAKTDRLNPLIRARAVGRQVGRMIGELHGAEPSDEVDALPPMTATQRQMVIDQLERIAVAEMGNAMIATGQPGFAQRNMRDRNALWDELVEMAPEVAGEMSARLTRGSDQAYSYDVVMELWPQVRDRIIAQGVNADLEDLARTAKRRSDRRQRRQTDDADVNAILFALED